VSLAQPICVTSALATPALTPTLKVEAGRLSNP